MLAGRSTNPRRLRQANLSFRKCSSLSFTAPPTTCVDCVNHHRFLKGPSLDRLVPDIVLPLSMSFLNRAKPAS